jgi:hypothetical protein
VLYFSHSEELGVSIEWMLLPEKIRSLNGASFIATMAYYEAHGLAIELDNGAKGYPEGWLRFVGMKAEEVGCER